MVVGTAARVSVNLLALDLSPSFIVVPFTTASYCLSASPSYLRLSLLYSYLIFFGRDLIEYPESVVCWGTRLDKSSARYRGFKRTEGVKNIRQGKKPKKKKKRKQNKGKMSTQENQDKPEGLSKYIKRMRTVLKRGSTKSSSISSMKDITGEASTSNAGPTKAPFGNVEVYVLFKLQSDRC